MKWILRIFVYFTINTRTLYWSDSRCSRSMNGPGSEERTGGRVTEGTGAKPGTVQARWHQSPKDRTRSMCQRAESTKIPKEVRAAPGSLQWGLEEGSGAQSNQEPSSLPRSVRAQVFACQVCTVHLRHTWQEGPRCTDCDSVFRECVRG